MPAADALRGRTRPEMCSEKRPRSARSAAPSPAGRRRSPVARSSASHPLPKASSASSAMKFTSASTELRGRREQQGNAMGLLGYCGAIAGEAHARIEADGGARLKPMGKRTPGARATAAAASATGTEAPNAAAASASTLASAACSAAQAEASRSTPGAASRPGITAQEGKQRACAAGGAHLAPRSCLAWRPRLNARAAPSALRIRAARRAISPSARRRGAA